MCNVDRGKKGHTPGSRVYVDVMIAPLAVFSILPVFSVSQVLRTNCPQVLQTPRLIHAQHTPQTTAYTSDGLARPGGH